MKKNESRALVQAITIALALLALIGAFSFGIDALMPSPRGGGSIFMPKEFFNVMEVFSLLQLVLASVNSILLVYLLYNYINIYNQIKSKFALGLIVAAVSFLAFTFSANPFVHWLFGFRGSGLGPFSILPLIFSLAVTIVLIYLSRE